MDTKSCSFEIKTINEEGTFEGYASIFDVTDLVSDVVRRGSFTKTLRDNQADFPILWMHRDLIGKTLEAREDHRGLWVRGRINLDVQAGREAFSLARMGAVKGMSIGYTVPRNKSTLRNDGVRELHEIKLYEVSMTPTPACVEARITAVKENRQDEAVEALRGVHNDLRKFYGKLLD